MVNNTRNILLIGRTGNGKSTLGNVLINRNDNFGKVFNEDSRSWCGITNAQIEKVEIDLGREKLELTIIETIGLGDTKHTPQGVLYKLAEINNFVKEKGLSQIFFVIKGSFTKEEIEAYDLLSSIIFDKDVLKYITIVRTGFPEFEDNEICEEDRKELQKKKSRDRSYT